MKILLILQSKNISGISYYRQLMPHAYMKTVNPEIELSQIQGARYEDVFTVPDEELKTFNVAILSREVDGLGSGLKTINRLRSLGIKVVLDLDDYWVLPTSHPLKRAYDHYDIPSRIVENIKAADYVTCTNKILANYIKEYNDKVMVLPNCVDKLQPQFKQMDIETDVMRFGWIGGVYHVKDIEPLERSFQKLWTNKDLKGKWSMTFGGFNVNQDRKKLEEIFTANYKHLDYNYEYYLKVFTNLSEHTMNNQPYKRIWALDVFNYVSMYNHIDVALIPLRDTIFNNCKSELKVIEAGAMGKAAIVNDCYPYNEVCNDTNSIKIGYNRPHLDWYLAMKDLTLNPNKAKDLAAQLTIDCEEKFNINKITKERLDLYKWITR